MKLLQGFSDPALCQGLLREIEAALTGQVRFMEVCGTHTVAIFRSGLHSLLPKPMKHISGPGCPVCVTHESEVAAFLEAAAMDGVILATFGDLMRVPGPGGMNLKTAKAQGARVEVVYSAFDALKLAADNPGSKVVFLGVGFETTAPTIAATIKIAKDQGLKNFSALSFHKLVPPALRALVADPETAVEGFLLPGHVSTIIGLEPYRFLAEEHNVPSVIAGFDPLDILQGLLLIVRQVERLRRGEGKAQVVNSYGRAVADEGNPKARAILNEVFMPADGQWRGIGTIPDSGLVFRPEYAAFDAMQVLGITLKPSKPLPGCRCGDVLKGKMPPSDCPLFKKACTPASPVGPCMVSSEGSCAAYYTYFVEAQ